VAANIKHDKKTMVVRYLGLAVIIPLLIVIGSWAGLQVHEVLARVNQKVSLANELLIANENVQKIESLNIESFRSSGKPVEELYAEASVIINQFKRGSMLLGGFIGLVIGISLASLAILRYRDDYEPNRGECLSCVRCVDFCPVKPEDGGL
jgi:ferredoxin